MNARRLHPQNRRRPSRTPGFTLMELILAVAVASLVLVAINGILFAALRLREQTDEAVDAALPVQQTLETLRRDLAGTMRYNTNGILSGDFRVGNVTSPGLNLPADIELYTTTGALRQNEPWGEVQRVTYQLRLPADRSAPGKELIRSVTRNLLATITPQPEDQRMMGGISSIEFSCFDGSQWRNYWDTTADDTNLPVAVRVRIQPAGASAADAQPVDLVVPIDSQG
jgi:type II secretion system protein J